MDYIFGIEPRSGRDAEVLKTVGPAPSALSGLQEVSLTSPDAVRTHRFLVREHFRSARDSAGLCYDWYEIGCHQVDVDRRERLWADLAAAYQEGVQNA